MTNANETETLVWIVTRDDPEAPEVTSGIEGVFKTLAGARAFVQSLWDDIADQYSHHDHAGAMQWFDDYNAHEQAFSVEADLDPDCELPAWTVRAFGIGA